MTHKRSSPSCSEGLTVIELLVGMAVGLAVTGAVMALALSSKSAYETDKARNRLHQTLRASKEFLVGDIHQAGERLGDDFPAIELTDGTAGDPDGLILRRNLHEVVLPVCITISGTASSVRIGQAASPPPGCDPAGDSDADGWPDNLQAWRDYRLAAGGRTDVYIYDPITGLGEFFEYVAESEVLLDLTPAAGTTWSNDYLLANRPRVYLLEERRYELVDGVLQLTINQDTADPIHLVDQVENFQALAHLQDGSQQANLGFSDVWSELDAIQVGLDVSVPFEGGSLDRSWSLKVAPRNVLSER